jgi:hypothetical protein
MATMLMAFNSLVHSPYQSSGDGEIYKVSSEDFKLQRSAIQHLEYALEVGDEATGYWNLRYSADSLGLSDRRMRNYVFDVVDEVFGGLGSLPDYPKPRTYRGPREAYCHAHGLWNRGTRNIEYGS